MTNRMSRATNHPWPTSPNSGRPRLRPRWPTDAHLQTGRGTEMILQHGTVAAPSSSRKSSLHISNRPPLPCALPLASHLTTNPPVCVLLLPAVPRAQISSQADSAHQMKGQVIRELLRGRLALECGEVYGLSPSPSIPGSRFDTGDDAAARK